MQDENELIDEYCKSQNCSACNGTDINGEPNGYGCPDMEEYVNRKLSTNNAENINQ